MTKIKKGRFGEKLASRYLAKKGFTIVHSNWTHQWSELDLIGEKGNLLVFFEVKYRSNLNFGYGHEAVDYHKRRKLSRSIQNYLVETAYKGLWRFDIVSILKVSKKRCRFQHFEGVDLR